jgi:hypothetical protein
MVGFALIFALSVSVVVASLPKSVAPIQSTDNSKNSVKSPESPDSAGLGTWQILRQGCRGYDVFALQYLLRARGYSIGIDGVFGSGTNSAVRSFQSSRGLAADGVVGANTWSALVITVKYGSNGDAVKACQMESYAKQHWSLAVDGIFGSGTKSAIVSFQSAHGLSADGIVGPTTWRYLISHFTDLTISGSSGTGWYHYSDDGNDDWGTANAIAQTKKVLSDFYYARGCRIGVGDFSRSHGGPISGHASHQDGLDCDLRIVRADRAEAPTTYYGNYDRAATRVLLQKLWATGSVWQVLFNDPTLRAEGLCTYYSGHDDHLHVDWRY